MIFTPGDVLNFTGETLYKYEQTIGHIVLADQFCPCKVILTILENQKIKLFITESGICGGRSFNAYGQITPSGSVTFEYEIPIMTLPDGTWIYITDIIKGHLGATLSGPGINKGTLEFFGKFDGSTLVATSQFNAKCEVEWAANNIFTTPVKGPIKCSWTYDLALVN